MVPFFCFFQPFFSSHIDRREVSELFVARQDSPIVNTFSHVKREVGVIGVAAIVRVSLAAG